MRAPLARALALLALAGWPAASLAYWAPNHEQMNRHIAEKATLFAFAVGGAPGQVKSLDDYLREVLLVSGGLEAELPGVGFIEGGKDQPVMSANRIQSLGDWNAKAGAWEDGFEDMTAAKQYGGLRAVNHFHNPLDTSGPLHGGYSGFFQLYPSHSYAGGYAGTSALLGYGASVIDWVQQNGRATVAGTNYWGLQTASDSLQYFLGRRVPGSRYVNRLSRPESGLSHALRAIGQVEHLVEDNTIPDHARDLPHPGEGWEEFMAKTQPLAFTLDPAQWVNFPLGQVEQHGLRGIWDQDVYSSAPGVTWRDGALVGLDEFVSANFFAYNVLDDEQVHAVLDKLTDTHQPCLFTTIPDQPHQPFRPTWVPTRTTFPWPELGDQTSVGGVGGYWRAYGDTLDQVPYVAHQHPQAGILCQPFANSVDSRFEVVLDQELDAAVWDSYTVPLMSRALGYATAPLKLLFQPVQAELRMRADDPSSLELHLFNKGSGEDGVTWHLRAVRLVPVVARNGSRERTDLDPYLDTEVVVPTPGNRVLDVGPGEEWVSPAFRPDVDGLTMLDSASYVSVVVDATIGAGDAETPISFGVPIPSAYVHVVQEHLYDATSPASFDSTPCNTPDPNDPCAGVGGLVGSLREPLTQRITGRVELLRPAFDTAGQPLAGTATEGVVKARARIAGMALVVRNPNSPDLRAAYLPTASSLALTGAPNLAPANGSGAVWIRRPGADDVADPDSFTFDVSVDLSEFGARASQAANDLYLVSWTQAGNFWLQKLIVWLPTTGRSAGEMAGEVNACQAEGIGGLNLRGSYCGQDWSYNGSTCVGPGWSQHGQVSVTLAGTAPLFSGAAGALYQELGRLHLKALGGIDNDGNCTAQRCATESLSASEAWLLTETPPVPGACPGPGTPPDLPRTASFERAWSLDGLFITRALGLTKPDDQLHFP